MARKPHYLRPLRQYYQAKSHKSVHVSLDFGRSRNLGLLRTPTFLDTTDFALPEVVSEKWRPRGLVLLPLKPVLHNRLRPKISRPLGYIYNKDS
jgi:hypothetical protein